MNLNSSHFQEAFSTPLSHCLSLRYTVHIFSDSAFLMLLPHLYGKSWKSAPPKPAQTLPPLGILHSVKFTLLTQYKQQLRDWRRGVAIRCAFCFPRAWVQIPAPTLGGLQPPRTPAAGDLTPSCGLHGPLYMWHILLQAQTHTNEDIALHLCV